VNDAEAVIRFGAQVAHELLRQAQKAGGEAAVGIAARSAMLELARSVEVRGGLPVRTLLQHTYREVRQSTWPIVPAA